MGTAEELCGGHSCTAQCVPRERSVCHKHVKGLARSRCSPTLRARRDIPLSERARAQAARPHALRALEVGGGRGGREG